MNSLLVVALALPILGIVGVVATAGPAERHDVQARWVTGAAAVVAAAAWAIVAGASEPPEVGGIVATTDLAVAAAGTALLVAGARPTTTLGRAASLAAVTAFAAGAGSGAAAPGGRAAPGLPGRPFAAGVVALVVLGVVATLAERPTDASATTTGGRAGALLALAAGVVSAAALSLEDAADLAPVMALAAVAVTMIVALRTSSTASHGLLIALPGLILATDTVVAAAPRTDDLDRVGLAAAAVAALAATATVRARRDASTPISDDRWRILPLAAVGAGVAVAFQTFPDARGAGLLRVAGGIVALAAAPPGGLVATLPGLTATLTAFGAASEPEHAAAAGAAVALVLVATLASPPTVHPPASPVDRGLVAVAVGFGVVPLWGWTGLVLADHALGLAVATAFALPTVVARCVVDARRTPAMPGVRARTTGRLPSCRVLAATPTHGSTILDFEGEVPVQDDVPHAGLEEELEVGQEEAGGQEGDVDEDPEDAEDGRPPQPAVAVPPQPVPVRARRDRAPLRGRVRARPGRTP